MQEIPYAIVSNVNFIAKPVVNFTNILRRGRIISSSSSNSVDKYLRKIGLYRNNIDSYRFSSIVLINRRVILLYLYNIFIAPFMFKGRIKGKVTASGEYCNFPSKRTNNKIIDRNVARKRKGREGRGCLPALADNF